MPSNSHPGGFRIGKLFETASGRLLNAIGYTIVLEDEEFECRYHARHRKKPHEIDILAKFSSSDFLRPRQSQGDFALVSCTTRFCSEEDIIVKAKDLSESMTCVRREGYSVDYGVVLLNQTIARPVELPHLANRLFLWDERIASLYAYKAYVFGSMNRIPLPIRGNPVEKRLGVSTSFFWDALKHEKKDYYTHNAVVFAEKHAPLNRADFQDSLSRIIQRIRTEGKAHGTLYVSAHSLSGFTDDLRANTGQVEASLTTSSLEVSVQGLHDHSLALWWPVLELSAPHLPPGGYV